MHGLLIVDKPAGPTSHDVVARLRRALREKRIGHTGTLDPLATGVLVLVVGKATRLAKFLSASDKSYEAVIRWGFATDTADAQGQPIGEVSERRPSRDEIEAALDAFRGTFLQQPPAFSAKKIDGQRSYKLARAARRTPHLAPREAEPHPAPLHAAPHSAPLDAAPHLAPREVAPHPAPLDAAPHPAPLPAACRVTTTRLDIVSLEADSVTVSVDCSAGFYIRSLAHDVGQRLGIGAHLTSLRRTRTGDFGLDRALPLDVAERDPAAAVSAMVPLSAALPSWPEVVLTADEVRRIGQGQDIANPQSLIPSPFVRLLDSRGQLVAVAEPAPGGALHPSVVLV
jgi:tRNA pseudouridine55 synthase